MEEKKKFIINFTYYAILLVAVFVFLKFALPMVTPFVLAFIIAYILQKPIRFVHKKININKKFISIIFVILFYCTIGVIVFTVCFKLISTVKELILGMPYIYDSYIKPAFINIFNSGKSIFVNLDKETVDTINTVIQNIFDSAGSAISRSSVWLVSAASGLAVSIPGIFISLLLMIISTFFISADYDKISGFLLRQLDGRKKEVFLGIKDYVIGTLFVCIRSYALIMSITFVELSIGLTIIGINKSVLIALVIAVFDILPVLGTGGVMIPWAIIELILGDYKIAIGLLAVYVAVTVIRNIIEPKIVGSQIGLHPVITLISMFIGVQFFGVLGLFGFPITISLLTDLNKKGVIKLYKE